MKAKSIVAGAAAIVLGFALVASAASYSFSNYLSVGSTGADVSALQNLLIAGGYSIPSISSGAAQPGYFGSQTQAAVKAYQAANSIPSTGFVGPLTVASLNKGGTAVVPGTPVAMGCPAGFTCTPIVTTPVTCPAGVTCTPIGTTPTTGITTPGVAGSLDVSNGSFVGNGSAVNDGQEVDLGSVALQTGASDMQVSSVAIDFNVRPWLYMSSLSIRDTTGKVLGEVDNLNSSNFTEITVGSDYRINIPISIVLPKATRTIAVLHGVFGTSNRTAQNIAITQIEVRSVDGTGVTLTSDFGNSSNPNLTAMYASYGGSSNSSLVVSIDPNSPVSQTIQTNTGNTQTKNILLGVFDLKSQNINATLQGLTVNLSMTGQGSVGTVFANLQLNSGSTLLNTGNFTNSLASTTSVTFSNFNLALPQNVQVPVSVYATINGNVNAVTGSVSLVANATNITGIDSSSNNLTISSTGTLPGASMIFSLSGVSVSGLAWSINPTLTGGNYNRYPSQTIFSGSVTVSAGNNALYLSSNGGTALTLATSSPTVGANLNATFASFAPSNGVQVYDNLTTGPTYYQIPSGGSRTFNFNGTMALTAPSTTQILANAGVTSINLNTSNGFGSGTAVPYNTLLQGLNSDFHVAGAYLNGTN
jgi:hypothetical protein